MKQNNKTALQMKKSLQQLILFALKDYNKSDAYKEEFDDPRPFWYKKKICCSSLPCEKDLTVLFSFFVLSACWTNIYHFYEFQFKLYSFHSITNKIWKYMTLFVLLLNINYGME